MNKEFVPYELAVKFKELGFDEPCFGFYSNGELIYNTFTNNEMQRFRYAAPTFSQAFRWFREKGRDIKIRKEPNGLYSGFFYWDGAYWLCSQDGSYEEAERSCLEKLIELTPK